jgi:protein-disulfide isomerase/type II secretory pathway component PulC
MAQAPRMTPAVRTVPALVRAGAGPVLVALALQGCSRHAPAPQEPAPPPAGTDAAAAQVVATLGGRSITAAEADARVAAQLHQLDHERYRLRRQATEALLLHELTAPGAPLRTARIELRPPLPAAMTLEGEPAAVRPESPARVTVTVFCNFQSPHCASVQATLADLLSLYPGSLRIAARDLPLPMHPLAPAAAEAARCAGRQGRYWAYHDLLWARGREPDRAELDAVARASGLDAGSFRECLDGRAEAGAVIADLELARRLGLGAVPAVFVNDRPAVPPVTPDQLMWLVEEELQRIRAPGMSPTTNAPPTRLPLSLRATIVGPRPGLGLALIAGAGPESEVPAELRREGERVAPQAILQRVGPEGVELRVDGRVESLSFASSTRQDGEGEGPAAAAPATEAPGMPGRSQASPMPVFLDREAVRERMADRVALSSRLQPVLMTVDGYRLLQLGDVPPGSLYELLGLQEGDVIVAVNEQPIHEGDNPLWDALDREQEVRVRVMRRGGIAHHYTYRFE